VWSILVALRPRVTTHRKRGRKVSSYDTNRPRMAVVAA
jgi:hypothetical protein